MPQMPKKTVKLCLSIFAAVVSLSCISGCGPRIIVSPYKEIIWLDKGTKTPHEGWLVNQGMMDEIISRWEPPKE